MKKERKHLWISILSSVNREIKWENPVPISTVLYLEYSLTESGAYVCH
jgi:hypothetical protein